MTVKLLLTEHDLEFLSLKGQACLSLHLSKCYIVGNHMSRLINALSALIAGSVRCKIRRFRRETDYFKNYKRETNCRGHFQTPVICPCGYLVNYKPLVSCKCMRGSRGGGDQKNKGFLSNTGLDPLKNHKATKPAFNFGPLSACQRNPI